MTKRVILGLALLLSSAICYGAWQNGEKPKWGRYAMYIHPQTSEGLGVWKECPSDGENIYHIAFVIPFPSGYQNIDARRQWIDDPDVLMELRFGDKYFMGFDQVSLSDQAALMKEMSLYESEGVLSYLASAPATIYIEDLFGENSYSTEFSVKRGGAAALMDIECWEEL